VSTDVEELQKRIETLEARNKRVELDKAWETSSTRRVAIILVTYCVVTAFLLIIKNDKPFINAIVPSLGFFLSTLVVSGLKKRWVKARH
jgi:hypothetical protein